MRTEHHVYRLHRRTRGVCRVMTLGAGHLACLVPLFLLTSAAPAAQVTVKNDSATDGSTVALQQGFVSGERAAAWLTSPCDGRIVALQVFWMSPSGGQPPSLEDSITVYAAGAFPNPGPVLRNGPSPSDPEVILLGPVMQDGGLNEFRFLDEDQQIPLAVPVTTGQVFVVSFRFESTPGTTGPTVATDIDGCQNGKNGLYAIPPSAWFNSCALGLSGDFIIRAVVDCAEPTGACCDGSGGCTDGVEQGNCQGAGMTFFVGQTCAQVSCPQPTGACCGQGGGCLQNQTQDFCENSLGGIYAGNGTNCNDNVCSPGACCLPDGSCEQQIEAVCNQMGGAFHGAGVACGSVQCPQPVGACCVNDVCVADQTEADCVSFGGVWMGPISGCAPDPCQAALSGDLDGDGDVDLDDFGMFAACYNGANNPPAPSCPPGVDADLDGDGDVDLDDFSIFAAGYTGSL